MNNLKRHSKILALVLMLGLAAGCAKGVSTGEGAVQDDDNTLIIPSEPPVTDNNPLNAEAGGTAFFTYDSIGAMTNYIQTRPPNYPQNMKVNVQLRNIGNGRYAGSVKLAYFDNGYYYIGTFESGFGYNQVSYKDMTTGLPEAEYNRWMNDVADNMGKNVFRGFFQDRLGAVMLVIDDGIDLGDGGGYSQVNGSIWFRNFGVTQASQSPEKCWFIQIGPYDCRAFVNPYTGYIDPKLRTYPNSVTDGYQRLGTFQALDKTKAFVD